MLLYIALWQKHLPHQFLPIKITHLEVPRDFHIQGVKGKSTNALV